MFALRRVAFRALQCRPTRQLSSLRPVSSAFQAQNKSSHRSFHQSRLWLVEEAQNKPASSPAEQEGGKTVTAEPSAAEQESAIEHESIATPEVADAAQISEAPVVENTTSTLGMESANGAAKPSTILYVGNLFFEVTTAQLEAEFAHIGKIVNSRIVTDPRGMSKGFGYLEFATLEEANEAIRQMDQKVFQGRRMAVQHHIRRESRGNEFRSSRGPSRPSKTLFIGNMSYQMSDRDLNDLFREVKNVVDVRVAIDRRSGQPRGFAHADFLDVASAEKAKAILEGKVVYGRQLKIDFSTSTARPGPTGSSRDAS